MHRYEGKIYKLIYKLRFICAQVWRKDLQNDLQIKIYMCTGMMERILDWDISIDLYVYRYDWKIYKLIHDRNGIHSWFFYHEGVNTSPSKWGMYDRNGMRSEIIDY